MGSESGIIFQVKTIFGDVHAIIIRRTVHVRMNKAGSKKEFIYILPEIATAREPDKIWLDRTRAAPNPFPWCACSMARVREEEKINPNPMQ